MPTRKISASRGNQTGEMAAIHLALSIEELSVDSALSEETQAEELRDEEPQAASQTAQQRAKTAGNPADMADGGLHRAAGSDSAISRPEDSTGRETSSREAVRTENGMPTGEIDWQEELGQHHRWLRSIVYARLGEPDAVDDVMQEVALAAVKQQAPLQDHTKVGPWLYRLAVRQTLLYRRKLGRKRKLTQRYAEKFQPTEEAEAGQYNPLQWILSDERQGKIRQALSSLKPNDAQILMLKYYENWNYFQIADYLGVSHSAVEARLHRARSRLRQLLLNMEVVEDRQHDK